MEEGTSNQTQNRAFVLQELLGTVTVANRPVQPTNIGTRPLNNVNANPILSGTAQNAFNALEVDSTILTRVNVNAKTDSGTGTSVERHVKME